MNHRVPVYNLFFYRERTGLSQRAFAKEVGLTLGTYGNLERGHTRCASEETIRRLARAYHVQPWQLRHPRKERA